MEVNKPYYAARNVELDERFLPVLPDRYNIFRCPCSVWQRIESLRECAELENVILVPEERLGTKKFAIFAQ
jgi:hypothetical protein